VVLRLLILKHVRNWSYQVLEREVRANLVYRDFTRVGGGKTPDAKTMGRWGLAVDPETIKQIHDRIVQVAQEQGVTQGRRMRVDTTVVETNIHYPTDSTLLGDGVRVLIRTMKKVTKIVGTAGTKLRDRTRSVKRRLLDISRTARAKGPLNHEKLKQGYRRLLNSTSRVVGQAKRFCHEISAGVKRARGILKRLALRGLRQELETMIPLVRQVMRQTRERIFRGNTRAEDKLFSVFEPSTEIIRKGKAGKPNEFGKVVKLQEAENQIVIDYEVYDRRPNDSDLLVPAIEIHQAKLGRTPRLVAADAGFYSARNEAAAKARGVKRVCIPNRSTKSVARKREQKKRWFRNGQKWRTGCEGRISVAKRRHGLDRCRYKGSTGMKRWVGLGVVADNLLSIGRVMEERSLKT
jgi:IS5 family transposase